MKTVMKVVAVLRGLMEANTMVNGKMANSTVLVFIQLAVAKGSLDCGRMANELNGLTKPK